MQRQKLRSNRKKKFGHRNGRSSCAHSIGKFFLCYIVLFSFETSATGSPGNYLYKQIFHCAMWLCSIWCWAIPVCPRRYSLSELLTKLGSSQSDSHHNGWQMLSENVRERERSNRKSTTITTSGLFFEVCAALLWGQEPLLSLSSCFFEKFAGIVARKIAKKQS